MPISQGYPTLETLMPNLINNEEDTGIFLFQCDSIGGKNAIVIFRRTSFQNQNKKT